MKKTIRTLKAQRLWGKPMKENLIYDISDILINLPLTASRKDIEEYINKCEKENR